MSNNRIDPCLFVVFGATGDLNRRKLLPALYHLARRGLLNECLILGVARSTELNDLKFRALAREVIDSSKVENAAAAGSWCDHCVYYRSIGGSASWPGPKALVAPLRCTQSRRRLPSTTCSSNFAMLWQTS